MKIFSDPKEMTRFSDELRRNGKTIAFVPTMGYLHDGHLSLMREGRRRADVVIASIFVNPTQFGPREDLSRYPRNFERDCMMMSTVPVDAVFAPAPEVMYRRGAQTWVEVTEVTRGLCGKGRPGHFRGVTTVVAKLFNIVKPHLALFGEKDFQQLRAIQRMVLDLDFDLEIVPMPIVREADGLAMSSRNAYLSPENRREALALSRALGAARELYARGGARTSADLAAAAIALLRESAAIEIEYVEAVDAETLEPAESLERPILLAIAAKVGNTRLIDNIVIEPHQSTEQATLGK